MYSVNAILPMEFFFFSRFVGEREGARSVVSKLSVVIYLFTNIRKNF